MASEIPAVEWATWLQVIWIWIAAVVALLVVCSLDEWQTRRRSARRSSAAWDQTIRDAHRTAHLDRLERLQPGRDFTKPAAKGISEESKRARLIAATKLGARR